MNWKFGIGILGLAFQVASLSAQGHEDRLGRLDVTHYRFELSLTDLSNEIRGLASVSVKLKKPGQLVDLDLASVNEDAQGMTVEGVTLDGKSLTYQHTQNLLSIQLPQAAKAGDVVRLAIQYKGEPIDGLIISKNKFGSRTFFGDNWPNRAHHWLPVVDHPSDKATVEFIVTAPEHYQVVANGLQLEESTTGNHSRITHWKSHIALPTKVMVIGAADFAVRHSGEVDGKPVSAWVYPENKNEGFDDYGMAVPILKYYTQLVAPYPYEKLANVQSKTRYGGMENAG
jgi:aminopeptidase N